MPVAPIRYCVFGFLTVEALTIVSEITVVGLTPFTLEYEEKE